MNKSFLLVVAAASLMVSCSTPNNSFYDSTFELADVQLLDGPFKHAMDLNLNTLKQYDVDRLLAPYLIQAGLEPKAEPFSNWAGLDGHVTGHYLSALAMYYGATGDEWCKERMDYMLSEMKSCQDALGNGYVGGVPDGQKVWDEVRSGNVRILGRYWVPWYNMHKTFAGLRDAWYYGNSEMAKEMFFDLCDWGAGVIEPLDDEQMESMLNTEYGGMNEVYADAYAMSGDIKYLDIAKRFTHHRIFDSMLAGVDNLDGLHANTQVPKAVGFERTSEMLAKAGLPDEATEYNKAADFFWKIVSQDRSIAFGGNSRSEHFPTSEQWLDYIDDVQGPESCNTNNMLKLAQGLFRVNHDVSYADFMERALLNHILSTQHPEHGGYVYFTPARPEHYRVYSQPNSGMWCCVGTGMENHAKYGEFIYAKDGDDLYVNLFIASELNWKEKKMKISQQTEYPYSENSKLTISAKNTQARLMIRHPWWCDDFAVSVNGEAVNAEYQNGYVVIDRKWKEGDVVEISFPMKAYLETLNHEDGFVAFMYGPVLLGTKTGTEDLEGLIADDGRWAHIAHGPKVPLEDVPTINPDEMMSSMQPISGKSLHFTTADGFELEPFFKIHDSRYIIYWPVKQ